MSEPLVTALVSTYASERYLRGCLDDLLQQTLGDRLEIVVVDADSPEREGAIVREYQSRHPGIRYLRLPRRVNTSEAFLAGTAIARGRYLTTANTDDRHRPDALARLATVLEQRPGCGIVYADSLITHRDNETWASNSATTKYQWPDFTLATALGCCLFGAQALWRRAAHDQAGSWDPGIVFANDQDLFLRLAWRCGAVHLRETLGLFLMRPDSQSGSGNRERTLAETMAVLRHWREHIPLADVFPGLRDDDTPLARAAARIELGTLCALGPYTDAEAALAQFRAALAEPVAGDAAAAVRGAYANNSGCVLAAAGALDAALRAFATCPPGPPRRHNEERLRAALVGGGPPRLRDFAFVDVPHPVVAASRRGAAVVVDGGGAVVDCAPVEQLPWDVYEGPNGVPATASDRGTEAALPVSQPDGAVGPHVLLVMYGWADSGGGTMLPRQAAHALVARGHRVSVFYAAADRRPELGPYGVRRHHEGGVALFGLHNRPSAFMDLGDPAREIDDPAVRDRFAALLDELRPDVVHFWNLHNLGMSLAHVAKARALPTVLSSNNYWSICPRLYLVSERLQRCEGGSDDGSRCERCLGTPGSAAAHAARKAAGVAMLRFGIDVHLAVSSRVRDLHVQNGDDPAHVRVLRQEPAMVAEIWRHTGSRRELEAALARPLRVGFVGSVMAHKGVHVLARALQDVPAGSVQAVAFGDVAPDYLPVLRHLDPAGHLRLSGRYPPEALPELLAALDVVVVPSVWDDCAPFVVAEALAARCPVLGSAAGGIPDFVQHGHNGLLFPAGCAAALAACLRRFAAEPELLGRLQRGIAAPRGLPAFAGDLAAVYAELLAVPAGA
jgi:glycosyltransferase involved in cell wall biosynthesis/predicted nucleic acid-binding protein